MMTLRKANERGHSDHGWLNTWFTFSFADYHDPQHMGFRSLRVINDDTIAPGGGFDMHPHRDMEIITYVLKGALEHRDSMGNGRTIQAGECQYMAAGTGVLHSEFNPSDKNPVHLLQIWIKPDRPACKPTYHDRSMNEAARNALHLVASKTGRDGSFTINQDAELHLARLDAGAKVSHTMHPGRHAWLHVAEGDLEVNGVKLNGGDGLAINEESELSIAASSDAQLLLFDLK